jgi:trk system potassium uptake protein TrkH
MIDNIFDTKNRPRIDFSLIIGVLGGLVFFLGLSLLVPMLVALIYDETSWKAFLITATCSSFIGGSLYYIFKPSDELRIREAIIIVATTWLVGSLIGALPFILSGALESYTDAVFETMSGFSTTGATILGGTTHSGILNPDIEALDKCFNIRV